jgi:alpha-D-ribose 1-methylphosphonate 5-triphosphate synthase subunit PhnH
MRDATLSPGFSDPVHEAGRTFRHAAAALSEPGTVHEVKAPLLPPLNAAAYALCLTLLDTDTPLWLSPSLDTPAIRRNLAFHCACPLVQDPRNAAFALLKPGDLDVLSVLESGTDRDPHLSCTVLMLLDSLDTGPAITLRGPGILGARSIELPLPIEFWRRRGAIAFPRGLDFFFTAGRHMVALPRSTRTLQLTAEGL